MTELCVKHNTCSTYYTKSQSAWEMFYQTENIVLHECHERLSLLLFATRDVSEIFGVQSYWFSFWPHGTRKKHFGLLYFVCDYKFLWSWLNRENKLRQKVIGEFRSPDRMIEPPADIQKTNQMSMRSLNKSCWGTSDILISSDMFVVYQEHSVNSLWMLKLVKVRQLSLICLLLSVREN